MCKRSLCWLSLAAGLGLAVSIQAQEPTRIQVGQTLPSFSEQTINQQMADTIATQLRQTAQLKGYAIDVRFANGTAVVSGRVADQPQKDEVLRIVQGVPGVEKVRDKLAVGDGILPAQAPMPPAGMAAPMMPGMPPMMPGAMGMPGMMPPMGMQGPMGMNAMGQPFAPMPMPGAENAGPGMGFAEPIPVSQTGYAPPYAVEPPVMPPYAWPTYAPYNNFSRVAYPTAYPYHAWPFIGPCYPFPKIPLSWRSVKLQWEDGYWWFSKTATRHDWWRLRYW